MNIPATGAHVGLTWKVTGVVLGLCAAALALSATPVKNPLYGDPAHPNISGMWNPEYAYFGPPIGDAAKPAGPRCPATGGAAPVRPGRWCLPGQVLRPPANRPRWRTARRCRSSLRRTQKSMPSGARSSRLGEQDPDPVTRCLAFGLARFGTMPMEIIQTPGQVTMNLGVLHDIRRIYMDGIGHTIGADPSFNGDSVGRWEGDTLVVETNNIRAGHPRSRRRAVLRQAHRGRAHPPREPDASGNRDDTHRPGSVRQTLHSQACVCTDASRQPVRGISL